MRIALVLLALAACSEPTGLDQTWPPKLGLAVEAVTAADLDGDGAPEVLVFASGGDHEAGIYRVEGNHDLALGTSSPIASFSNYVPLPLEHPTAALVAAGPSVLVASVVPNGVDMLALSNQLVEPPGAPIDAKIAGGNALLWMNAVTFPGNVSRVVISNGTAMQHMMLDGSDNRMVPAPAGPEWPTAELALTYPGSGGPRLVVATPTQVYQTTLATGPIAWTEPPFDHPPWLGQVAIDLDGDGVVEIVGYDPMLHEVCALDLGHQTSSCVPLATSFAGTEVTIAFAQVAGAPTRDLVIAQATATATDATIVTDVSYVASLAAASTAPRTVQVPHGRLVIVNAGAGTPDTALAVGTSGEVACVAGPC